ILLIPELVELDASDIERLLARADELKRFGLAIEAFGPGAIAVRETPSMLGEIAAAPLARDLAEHIAEWDEALPLERRLMHVAATMACYGSVRAGRRPKPEKMNELPRAMEGTPNSGQCNHGRPTYVELKLTDIERLFGRRQGSSVEAEIDAGSEAVGRRAMTPTPTLPLSGGGSAPSVRHDPA